MTIGSPGMNILMILLTVVPSIPSTNFTPSVTLIPQQLENSTNNMFSKSIPSQTFTESNIPVLDHTNLADQLKQNNSLAVAEPKISTNKPASTRQTNNNILITVTKTTASGDVTSPHDIGDRTPPRDAGNVTSSRDTGNMTPSRGTGNMASSRVTRDVTSPGYSGDAPSPHDHDKGSTSILVLTSILTSVGCLGNIASFVVLRSMERNSFTTYMAYVSLADLTVTTNNLLNFILNWDIENGCRWHLFPLFWSADVSVWLLVSVTIDRYIAVCHPLRKVIYCTPKRANVVSLSLLVLFGIIHIVPPILITVAPIWENLIMSIDLDLFCGAQVWQIFIFLYNIIPVCSMLTLNSMIIFGLIQQQINRYKLTHSTSTVGGATKTNLKAPLSQNERKRQSALYGTVRNLLVISLFASICNIPELFITICEQSEYCDDRVLYPNLDTLLILSMVGINLNHCFNFVLYCVTSANFRERLKAHVIKILNQCRTLRTCSSVP